MAQLGFMIADSVTRPGAGGENGYIEQYIKHFGSLPHCGIFRDV